MKKQARNDRQNRYKNFFAKSFSVNAISLSEFVFRIHIMISIMLY